MTIESTPGVINDSQVEPGLLALFRVILGVQFALTALTLATRILEGHLTDDSSFVWPPNVIGCVLLLGYLTLPWSARHRLGRHYLPVAFILVIIVAVCVQAELLELYATTAEFDNSGSAWQVFLLQFLPLMLVGWQYRYRTFVAYLLLATSAEFLVLYLGHPDFIFHGLTYLQMVLTRTVTFAATGYVICYIMRRQRSHQRQLLEANRQVAAFAATLEQLATSTERNRIARELHDTLAHSLTGMAVQMEAARSLWDTDTNESSQLLDSSLATARTMLAEIRRVLHALRATPLERNELRGALAELASTAAGRGGFLLELDLADPPELPQDVAHGVFRIAQESVENVVRHANARRVTVHLHTDANRLLLRISDDGRGFDPSAVSRERLGLTVMRERATILGGHLDLGAAPGQGTRVRLTVPLGGRLS